MEQHWLKTLATSELSGSKWIIREAVDYTGTSHRFLQKSIEQLYQLSVEATQTYNNHRSHQKALRTVPVKDETGGDITGFIFIIGKQQLKIWRDKNGITIQRVAVSGFKSQSRDIALITATVDQFGGCDLKVGDLTVTPTEIIRKMLVNIHRMTFTLDKDEGDS